MIATNHGHTAVVSAAQIAAGVAITLDITGSSGHPHTVDLSGSELTQIGAGQSVTKTSSNDAAHVHTVTFN